MRAHTRMSLVLALTGAACSAPVAPSAAPGAVPHVITAALRPDAPNAAALLFRFDPGDDVEHYDSAGGHIRVHFTRAGDNAVRALDEDDDGTPDDVVVVADTYEAVLANQATLGFRAPVSDSATAGGDGGDDRFDVYLLDFAGVADGTFVRERCGANGAGPSVCSGYMVQENDYAGYGYPSFTIATRILSSHELFHAVQAAYDDGQGANWTEATAVWATEQFDASLFDFEGFLSGWFERPDRSVDTEPTGPVDGYSYGLAILPQYLSERFGAGIVREIWDDAVDGAQGVADPHWLEVLAERLETDYATTFEAAWHEFARWVVQSGIGGPAGTTWANAGFYPRVARTAVEAPASIERLRMFRASLRAWTLAPAGRAVMAAELVSPDAADFEGQGLILAARKGTNVTVANADGAYVELGVAGANEVIVVVASGLTTGGSKRPSLCIGSVDEVGACKAAILAQGTPEATEVGETGPETDAAETAPDEASVADGSVATSEAEDADTATAEGGDRAPDSNVTPAEGDGCAGGTAAPCALLAAIAFGGGRRRAKRA